MILGFDETEDTIDLDALFDDLGIADDDRADMVEITDTGDDAVITIEGVSGFSITLEDVDLDTPAELDALKNAIIVSDES